MTIRLTSADITEHLQQTQGSPSSQLALPRGAGSLHLQVLSPSQEITLGIQQYELQHELQIVEQHPRFYLGIGFCLSGSAQYQHQEMPQPCVIQPGLGILTGGTLPRTVIHANSKAPLCVVELQIQPTLVEEIADKLEGSLQESLDLIQSQDYHHQIWQINPDAQAILRQIINCPFRGIVQKLFLQAKGIELLALCFDQVLSKQSLVRNKQPLSCDEIDRIYQAQDILNKNLEDPPSLIKLARQVGLSDWKLKQGFRQVLRTTAFGYLHQQRMSRAYQILQEKEHSVTQVALSVGYTSLGSFINAFKKQFGITPGSLTKRG